MEPTNHPFGKENDLPNLHDYVPCYSSGVYAPWFPETVIIGIYFVPFVASRTIICSDLVKRQGLPKKHLDVILVNN